MIAITQTKQFKFWRGFAISQTTQSIFKKILQLSSRTTLGKTIIHFSSKLGWFWNRRSVSICGPIRAERLYRELDCTWPRVIRNLDFGVTRFHGGQSVISVVVITNSMSLYTLISLQYHAVSICYLDISFGSLFVMFALVIRHASDWLISGGFRIWFGLEV